MTQQVAGPFQNRTEAGRILSDHLLIYRGHPKLLVLGLPRGGISVAFEVATALRAPMDAFLVRRLNVPAHSEKVVGAIASGGLRVLDYTATREMGLSRSVVEATAAQERTELERREQGYRGGRPFKQIEGRIVILVDDGLATGSTMRTAIAALGQRDPERIVVAVPVGDPEACDSLRDEVDELICAHIPRPFIGVARWYRDFSPIMDRQIHDMLQQSEMALMESNPGVKH